MPTFADDIFKNIFLNNTYTQWPSAVNGSQTEEQAVTKYVENMKNYW